MNAVLLFVFLAPDAEFKRLDGTWDVIKEERGGKVVDPDRSIHPSKVKFTDVKPKGIEKRRDVYTLTVDPKADLRRLTATVAGGEIRGEKMLGIYRLDGDELTVRLHYGAKHYPKGFETAAGDDSFVLKLRRAKP